MNLETLLNKLKLENLDTFITAYNKLREDIDHRAEELSIHHTKHLKCKKGCDSCCENISVFPIEFNAIKKELENKTISLTKRKFNRFRKPCVFLQDGACQIYESRPIICRTQGLPLMYQNINGEGYEVSHCQLNFKGVVVSNFNVENTLFMPDYNSKLFLMNKEFIESENMVKKNPKKRIPLYKLID